LKRFPGWNSAKDVWQLWDLARDFLQATHLAAAHPENRVATSYRSWNLGPNTRRMPEFTAPGLGRRSGHLKAELELGDGANAVLYAVGGAAGGLTLSMDDGYLVYEYNRMILEQYGARSSRLVSAGNHTIEVVTAIEGNRTGGRRERDPARRRTGGRQGHAEAHRSGRVHSERDVRRRNRSRFTRLCKRFRAPSLRL
jgi:arylsulfatase